MSFFFLALDPRPQSREVECERLRRAAPVLGIEVTVPEFAQLCELGNIDPQHTTTGNVNPVTAATTAIEVAAIAWFIFPPAGSTLATVRADLDSVGAMAVFTIRAEDCGGHTGFIKAGDVLHRIGQVATADRHGRGEWDGPWPLPKLGEPPEIEQFSGVPAGLARLVGDFRRPLAERVALMCDWLRTGYCDGLEEAEAVAQAEYDNAVRVTKVRVINDTPCGSKVAVVESTHRGALGIGYHVAPVVVAVNEQFRFAGGEPGQKFTVAQYGPGYADMAAVLAALRELEPGWGGSPTIIGSPQGVASILDLAEVVQVVAHHLLPS